MPGWKPLIGFCTGVDGPPIKDSMGNEVAQKACHFGDFVTLIQNGIHDMVLISTLVVVALLCYVGYELLTSGGNPGAWTKAKSRLMKVVWGYVWVLAAWVIVYTIAKSLLNTSLLNLIPWK